MQLEVSTYLLVDTLTDWLAIQITFNEGVTVHRSRNREGAEAHYNSLKAQGNYHMLALVSGEGVCHSSEYKPFKIPKGGVMVETTLPVNPVKPFPDSPWPSGGGFLPEPTVSQEGRLPYGHPDTPEGKAHGIAPVKLVDLSGFTTGLPSGFKTGK